MQASMRTLKRISSGLNDSSSIALKTRSMLYFKYRAEFPK